MAFPIVTTDFIQAIICYITCFPEKAIEALNTEKLQAHIYCLVELSQNTYRAVEPIIKVLTIAIVVTRLIKTIICISARISSEPLITHAFNFFI